MSFQNLPPRIILIMLKCVKRPRMSFHLRPRTAFNLSPAAHNSRKVPVCAEARAGTTFPDAFCGHCWRRFSRVPRPSCPVGLLLVSAEEKWWKKDKNGPPLTVYTQTLAIASSVQPLLSNKQHKRGCNLRFLSIDLCPLSAGERRGSQSSSARSL